MKHPFEKEEHQDIDYCIAYANKETGAIESIDSFPNRSYSACKIRLTVMKSLMEICPKLDTHNVKIVPLSSIPT